MSGCYCNLYLFDYYDVPTKADVELNCVLLSPFQGPNKGEYFLLGSDGVSIQKIPVGSQTDVSVNILPKQIQWLNIDNDGNVNGMISGNVPLIVKAPIKDDISNSPQLAEKICPPYVPPPSDGAGSFIQRNKTVIIISVAVVVILLLFFIFRKKILRFK